MQVIKARTLVGLVIVAALLLPAGVWGEGGIHHMGPQLRPAGPASQPAGPASQPAGVASQPAGVASQAAVGKTDAEVIKEQLADYPLTTCVVSGEKLGEMGPAHNYVYKGRLVRFCCSSCVAQFNKDPNKYLAMIDKAPAAAATRPAGKAGDKVTR